MIALGPGVYLTVQNVTMTGGSLFIPFGSVLTVSNALKIAAGNITGGGTLIIQKGLFFLLFLNFIIPD